LRLWKCKCSVIVRRAHLLVEYMFMNLWKEFGTCLHLGIGLRASAVQKHLVKADECYCVGILVCEDAVYG
jgi:hypothetical protein